MKLYPYQENVIESCKKELSHSQLISMPTGTGKTITFLSLAKEFNKKTLILVHRDELLRQTYDKAKLCGFQESDIAIISAEKKDEIKIINIAMVQSLNRNLDKYLPDDIELVIVDEAHHATANTYRNIFKHFQIFENMKPIFGFTATPLRGDKDHLSNIFKVHTFKMTLSEATQLGYIVPVHGLRIEIDKSLSDIEMKQGDYDIQQLEKVMNSDSINKIIVDKCKNLGKTPSLIFTTSVNHAEILAKMLREQGRKAISVSYKTTKKSLSLIFRMLERGSIEFITNAVKLSEGFDFPRIQGIILARPTRSPVLYKQMIGRGLRNHPNKYDCYVMEFTSNDDKMMKWEDLDENATFQSSSKQQVKTKEEAKKQYEGLYTGSNVIVLDVRVSPFEFYECKIRRHIKYKQNYIFTPFSQGFAFFEIIPDIKPGYSTLYYLNCTMLFWKDKYKSFYVWDSPNTCLNDNRPDELDKIKIIGPEWYGKAQKFGKWYPSDLQSISREQKLMMKSLNIPFAQVKSARKAEMLIEDKCIKIAIDKYLSKHEFSGIMNIF